MAPSLAVLALITLLPSLYLLATSFTPLNLTRPETQWDFSQPLESYRQLLADAGFRNGFDAGDLTPFPPYTSMAEALGGWLQAVGIRTKVRSMERAIQDQVVTYDFARQMQGAKQVSCSGFGQAMIERM